MNAYRLIACTLLAGATLAGGCVSSGTSEGGVTEIEINEAQRLVDARRFAAEAQEAEDPDEAIRLYRQAVTTWGDFPAAWNNMGVLLLEQGRYMDAAESFMTANERAGSDPRPFYNLGLTWERTRHLSEAAGYYSEALAIDGRFLPALRGALYAEDRLGITNETTLERLRVALMLEHDPEWRVYFEERKLAAEAELAEDD